MPRLYPLFSGSSGNCYYIGSEKSGVLIDAGRSAKQLEAALRDNGLDAGNVRAVFVTHEHSDHIQGLRVFASRYGVKVYASAGTIKALNEKGMINEKVTTQIITADGTELDDMKITPFAVSHDCTEGFGYVVQTSDGRKTCFATDTGIVTPEMLSAIRGCDTAVIESNHDVGMLENGFYPYVLKRRILSEIGHLSNEVCAETACELVKSGTTRFVLAHLSRENNIPELAEQATLCTLKKNGMRNNIDFMLTVAGESGNRMIVY